MKDQGGTAAGVDDEQATIHIAGPPRRASEVRARKHSLVKLGRDFRYKYPRTDHQLKP
jgi:hypothetical protein